VPRVRGRLVVSLLVPLLTWSAAASGAVLRATGQLELGGGHDDNMLLATAPDAPTTLSRLGGWFGQVAPTLALGLGGPRLRLELSYAGDYRFADQVGHLYFQQSDLIGYLMLGPLRLHLGATGGRFDASRFGEDQFLFAGGEGGLRLDIGESWRFLGRYRGQWRRLGGVTLSTDLLHAGDGRIVYTPTSTLELGPQVSVLLVQPRTAGGSRFLRWRGGLEASVDVGPVTTSAGAWFSALQLGTNFERHVGGDLDIRWPVARSLAVFASAELAHPVSSGASQDYARRLFTVGLTVMASAATRPGAPPPSTDLRPLVQGGRVRLRVKEPAAAEVRVMGSWDDWQAPGQTLVRTAEPGLFEAWLTLPAGNHRYHFVVDGQARRPADAPRYAPDGFGGEDGVVEIDAVPETTEQAGAGGPP
jgi:hypothetical protein